MSAEFKVAFLPILILENHQICHSDFQKDIKKMTQGKLNLEAELKERILNLMEGARKYFLVLKRTRK